MDRSSDAETPLRFPILDSPTPVAHVPSILLLISSQVALGLGGGVGLNDGVGVGVPVGDAVGFTGK